MGILPNTKSRIGAKFLSHLALHWVEAQSKACLMFNSHYEFRCQLKDVINLIS